MRCVNQQGHGAEFAAGAYGGGGGGGGNGGGAAVHGQQRDDGWEEAYTEDGDLYYYNPTTGESQWEDPGQSPPNGVGFGYEETVEEVRDNDAEDTSQPEHSAALGSPN